MTSETSSTLKDPFQKLMLSPDKTEWKALHEFFTNENVDTKRASSKCRKNTKSSKTQSKKEQKILNVELNVDVFMSISDSFEDAVNQLEIVDGSYEQVLEKLIKIENLVKNKIFSLKLKNLGKDNSEKNSKHKNLDFSLSPSKLSLCSESSNSEMCLTDESSFKQFLINVNCPFCLKLLADKVNLIKHIDENCTAQLEKQVEKRDHIPFSIFQILPNNTFKCNVCPNSVQYDLKHYFRHLQSNKHILAYKSASKNKYYSKLLFCSCCKIQVFSTYTQIEFHINHEVHKLKAGNRTNSENFLKKGIHCAYVKSKKFKCFDCFSQTFFQTPKEILQHFEDPKHIKNIKKNVPNCSLVYCEFCCKEVHIFQIINHFTSNEHKDREKKEVLDESFELCFYCGFMCKNLMELLLHMKAECNEINDLRKLNLKSYKSTKMDLEETGKLKKSQMENNKSIEDFIIVKDYTEIPGLYKYFKKFGEIAAMEKVDGDNVMIKFQEKDTIEDILLLRNMHEINGIKIKIRTKPFESTEKWKEKKEANRSPCENIRSYSCSSKSESEEDESLNFESKLKGVQLESSFQRVSSHLMNNTVKLDSPSERKILSDCVEAIKMKCDFVGFSGCGLSFPLETISLYCATETELMDSVNENILDNVKDFRNDLIKKEYKKMFESVFWEHISTCFEGPFPQVKCKHRETQKTCTITFSQSAMVITHLLRRAMTKNDLIRPFCLIIRFWLAVHELKIKEFEYGLISLLVFFLISEKVVEFSMNYKCINLDVLLFQNTIQDKFNSNSKSSSSESFLIVTVTELFHRFLLFLNAFDFDKFCICLPLSQPVEKTFLSKNFNSPSMYPELLNSPMCIFDPYMRVNLTSDMSKKDVKCFKRVVDKAIKALKH